MKNPSRTPQNGNSLWMELLITASILSGYFHPTSAQSGPVCVVPNPPNGTVGSSITLDIQGFSGHPFSYTWFRKSVKNSNRLVTYHLPNATRTTADIRETVFPNGSLLIPNLTLNDTDVYIVQIADSRGVIATGKGSLTVYATTEESAERGNGSSFPKGPIAGFVTGVLAGVALIGCLISFLFFRKTGGASEPHLTDNKSSAPSQSQTCLDSSPNETEDVCYVFLNFSAQNTMAQSQLLTDSNYSEIKGK